VTVTTTTTTTQRMTDDQVVRLFHSAAAGERRGWDKLVAQFSGMILGVARAHRLCPADAADVVQATWLKLLAHLDDLNEPARVGAWLATTARRECLRVLRDSRRYVLVGEDVPELESTERPPEADLLLEERALALRNSFARLRPSDQSLLRLLMAEPRPSYEQISSAMEMPVGSIGPTRERALDRLRRELTRDESLTLLTA
jgi:RNA polymerase sigma factor (sigma-70 family)